MRERDSYNCLSNAYWTGDDDEFSWDEVYHAPGSAFSLPDTWPDLDSEYYQRAWRAFSPAELADKPLQDTYEADWLMNKVG